ncbi:MAG TPA: TonB family protein [Pyrinomonadaceae bacterium]|nr:TonB family protein [Pyrinomonadaceae bacterium]
MVTEEGNPGSSGVSLIRAVSNGDVDGVKSLLAGGVSVDQKGRGGHTPLMVAAIFGHDEIARLLIDAGAELSLEDNLGMTAKQWADRRGSKGVAELLSKASREKARPSPKNTTPTTQSQSEPEISDTAAEPIQIATGDPAVAATEQQSQKVEPEIPVVNQPLEAASVEVSKPPTEPRSARAPDNVRFLKFHKQIMAAQQRREAEQARREEQNRRERNRRPEEEEELAAWSLMATTPEQNEPVATAKQEVSSAVEPTPEENDATWPVPSSTASDYVESDSPQTDSTLPQQRQSDQYVRLAATINHLNSLEPKPQPMPAALGSNDIDATLERVSVPVAHASDKSKPAVQRCPKCSATFDNLLLKYCPYDATSLVSAGDSLFSYSTEDRSRQTLWALVAIIAVLGATLGYLINNYRSRQRLSSVPNASQPQADVPATELNTARKNSPVIGGALSGTEVDVPEPEYPASARADGVSGTVTVRVQVNQNGRVILARSSAGDWRLRAAAVEAAQKATFSPDKLAAGDRAWSGTITYNFIAPTETPALAESTVPANSNESPSPAAEVNSDNPVVGGPLAGAENNVPRPAYPENARRRGVSGAVTVVVRVNRAGRVISWRTLEGDSQLRAAALKAAKQATFSPSKLPGTGEVVGTITYNFKS